MEPPRNADQRRGRAEEFTTEASPSLYHRLPPGPPTGPRPPASRTSQAPPQPPGRPQESAQRAKDRDKEPAVQRVGDAVATALPRARRAPQLLLQARDPPGLSPDHVQEIVE